MENGKQIANVDVRNCGREFRVLIVEDDPDMCRAAAGMLERAGFKVDVAETAAGALKLFYARKPDLVLLDVVLPDDSGFNVCRELRERAGTEIPILFMSGRKDLESRLQGFQEGGQDYIAKPFFFEELLERVRLHLKIKWNREAMASRNAELRRRDRVRRDMVDMIVHDLKMPLTTIGATIKLINEDEAVPGELYRGLMHTSEKAVETMLMMISDILDIEEAEQGRLVMEWKRVAVEKILAEVKEHFQPVCVQRGIECRVAPPPEGLTVMTDPRLVSRILSNFLSNAMKCHRGQQALLLQCSQRLSTVRLAVCDRGPGVAEGDKKRIFGKRVRDDTGGVDPAKAYGIGLFFCRTAANALGGAVWVEDREDGGSRFVLEIPKRGGEQNEGKAQA